MVIYPHISTFCLSILIHCYLHSIGQINPEVKGGFARSTIHLPLFKACIQRIDISGKSL
jgi:hypothetical protein